MQISEIRPGLVLATEELPFVKSVSLGFWVKAGVAYEPAEWQGVSHYLEHLFFKGTPTRSARDISESFDNIGGELNAFTAKEYTCFYGKVVDEHLDTALDVLCDMISHARLDKADVEKERNVILEEVGMYEDSPEDYVHDLLAQAVWPNSPLGRSILGTRQTLSELKAEDIRRYYSKYYSSSNMVITAAGSLEHDHLLQGLKARLNLSSEIPDANEDTPISSPTQRLVEKQTEQLHLTLGFPGLKLGDEKLYAWNLLNNILGTGMSSRLFQRLREEHALVYSTYSYTSSFQTAGYSAIYLGLSPKNLKMALDLIQGELASFCQQPVTRAELDRAKAQVKGAMIMGLESTANHMSRMGRGLLLLNRVQDVDVTLRKIEAVTADELLGLANQLFVRSALAVAGIGNVVEVENAVDGLSW